MTNSAESLASSVKIGSFARITFYFQVLLTICRLTLITLDGNALRGSKMYTCPVCGYDDMPSPPRSFSICSSCGTEFGYDDFDTTHEELRLRWLSKGARWFSRSRPAPPNWNWYEQLLTAQLVDGVRITGTDSAIDPESIAGPPVYPVSIEQHTTYEIRF